MSNESLQFSFGQWPFQASDCAHDFNESDWEDLCTFEEFLKCSLAKRHATPIRLAEFEFLRALFDEPDENWMPAINKPGFKIQQKYLSSHLNCVLVRAFVEFADIEPDVVLYNLIDSRARSKWDTFSSKSESVEERRQHSDILYIAYPAPVVKDRDYVVYRRITATTNPREEGYLMLCRSTEHPSKPQVKSYIRGETHISGYMILRSVGSSTTQVRVASMSDPCGAVPKWLVNMFVSKKLHQFISSLKNASAEVQVAVLEDPLVRDRVSECTAQYDII